MEPLLAIVGPSFAIIGVIVGGAITARGQRRTQMIGYIVGIERDRRDACAQYLATFRKYRRFLMYSDPEIERFSLMTRAGARLLPGGTSSTDSAKGTRHLVGLSAAAAYADVSTRTLRRYIAQGRLTGYRVGPRLVKVDLTELDELARPIPTARRPG